MPGYKRVRLLGLLAVIGLACVTNTTISQVATPRPTRTLAPTFTNTPLPLPPTPIPTATDTPLPTEEVAAVKPAPEEIVAVAEVVEPTETPLPTDTPIPPTNTPPPPPPPANNPPPAPPPPTPTPEPSPTPVQSTSPLPTPTTVVEAVTPPGRYEALNLEGQNNCADIGVTGWVREKGNDQGVPNVTVQVVREVDDDDDEGDTKFLGPFTAKTDANGNYNLYIGPIGDAKNMTFKAKITGGSGVVSEDEPEWDTGGDCHDGNNIQVMRIEWVRKN